MWNDLKGFVQHCHARMVTLGFQREEGQGLVEYALIISLVSIALIGALTALAGGIEGAFKTITEKL